MKSARTLLLCFALLIVGSVQGWSQSSPAEALTNVAIHTADGNTIKSGTVVWRDGIIESAGSNVSVPFDAFIYDGGDSLHVYPGFIDGLALWGSPDLPEDIGTPVKPGSPDYERAGIQPHRKPSELLKNSDKVLSEAQKHGFTTAVLALKGQMLPGQVDLFFINGSDTKDKLFQRNIGMFAQFENARGAAYPSTTMALMAQFRQLFHDAEALKTQQDYFASTTSNYPVPEKNEVLEALFPVMQNDKPFYFKVDSKENIERLFWLQDELGFDVVLVSGKEAYKKADQLKQRNIPVLASIDLPEEPEWRKAEEDTTEAEEVKEEISEEMRIFRKAQLEAYEADIDNIRKLMEAGLQVGYASNGMELKEFSKNITTLSEESGLTDEQILDILTQSTADILGYGQKIGDIRQGRIASFTVFTKPFTDEETKAVYSVSGGELKEFESESSNKPSE